MGRRDARGGASRPASLEMINAVKMVGATGWTGSDYCQTANPGGEAGDAGGFGVVVLMTIKSQAVSSASRIITERQSAGTAGYSLQTLTTNAGIRFFAANGVGTTLGSATYTVTASDVGKIMMVVGVHDGDELRLYVNRAEAGAAQAIVGYTAASIQQTIGARSTGQFPLAETTIYGVSTFRGVKTLAQIQALYDDVKLARDILGSGMGPTNGWSFKRAGGTVPPASVANLGSGADAMSRVGSALTYDVVAQPVWGW